MLNRLLVEQSIEWLPNSTEGYVQIDAFELVVSLSEDTWSVLCIHCHQSCFLWLYTLCWRRRKTT